MSMLSDDPDDPPKYPLLLHRFPYPRVKRLTLTDHIETSHPQSQQLRDELGKELFEKAPASADVLRAATAYLPLFVGLKTSLAQNVKVKKPILFTWSSAFVSKDKYQQHRTYRFEEIMLLYTLAAANANRSIEIMATMTDKNADEAGKRATTHLRVAAGIFEYMATKSIFKWQNPPDDLPFECHPTVMGALRNVAIAEAQSCIVKKALLSGTSLPVVSKLSTEVYRTFDAALKSLRGMKPAELKRMPSTLMSYLDVQVVVQKANTLKVLGTTAYSKDDYGVACAYLRHAGILMRDLKLPKDKKDPLNMNHGDELEEANRVIRYKAQKYIEANANIYGAKEPDYKLMDIPDGTMMAKIEEFQMPKPAFDTLR